MKKLVATVVLVGGLAVMTASAAGATTYYVGHGDDHGARVSFKVRNGDVRSALLDIRRMPVKRANGTTTKIHAVGSVARAPHVRGSDSAFRGVKKSKSHQLGGTRGRFGFSGHLWSERDPSGHTALKFRNDYFWFNTGKIRWDASSVSKKRFKKFRGIAGHLTRQR